MSLPNEVKQAPGFALVEDGDETMISVCSVIVGQRLYGIDIRAIIEVLGVKTLERVPLAPMYVGGVLPYRGEVLTVVNSRALLGFPSQTESGSVLVLKGKSAEEPFGFMVDSVGGVVRLEPSSFTANPSTLDEIGTTLYRGAVCGGGGFLDPAHSGKSAACTFMRVWPV